MNGTAALALLPPAEESRAKCLSKDIPADARSTAAKLGAAPAVTEIERQIGEATAGAVLAVSYAMSAYAADGRLNDVVRTVGGDSLGRLAQLRLDTLGQIDDFSGIAKREGRRALFRQHGAALRQLNQDAAELEKAFSELVSMAVSIAEKVAHDEQIFLRARAN